MRDSDSTGDEECAYFGLRLISIASPRAVAWAEKGEYLEDLLSRHADLVSALAKQSDPQVVYDLRYIASPAGELSPASQVLAVLLARVPKELASGDGHSRLQGLINLLHSIFPEFDFEEMSPKALACARRPFQIRHAVGIRRRCLLTQLDTLAFSALKARDRTVGFSHPSESPAPPSGTSQITRLLHVCPFAPELHRHNLLLDLLRGEAAPVMVSVRLKGTSLLAHEQTFLESQIAMCERHAQYSLGGASGALDALMPTLQEQARQHQGYQVRMLHGLGAEAIVMSMEVASPEPISPLVARMIGNLIAGPAGSAPDSSRSPTGNHLTGGFDICEVPEGVEHRFEHLELELPEIAGSPSGGDRLPFLFEPQECAAAFRFPAPGEHFPAGIDVRGWRYIEAPAKLPREGVVLGQALGHGVVGQTVRLAADDRMRHVYSVGQTGTGKSALLRSMILSDIEAGEGLCLVDPHGDLVREVLESVPKRRWEDVVLLDPTDVEWPVGLNLLEPSSSAERHFLIQEFLGIMDRLLRDQFGAGNVGQFTGPVFQQHVRMNLLLAMSRLNDPGTLLEFHAIFQTPRYWERWIPLEIDEPALRSWVEHTLSRAEYQRPGADGSPSLGSYISSKFDPFIFDPMLRLIFGQKRSTIRLDQIMDEGKILLVNLAKGLLTETNSRFLGMVLLTKLQTVTMARAGRSKKSRRPFHVYVDEFQNLATSSFTGLLSEARKFRVGMVLANQFLTQIEDRQITNAVLGNAGTLICFRLGQPDAQAMEERMRPAFLASDLQSLPNFQACVATLAGGEPMRPFSMRTILRGVESPDGESVSREVRSLSRRKYSRPRKDVEAEIRGAFYAKTSEPTED
ncbi:MAG: ATP-binding protein [Thermoanaerobaculia bacterium]|nr:MAG: ATP-binding protein [Thermoanaerobaculia bacterium]MBZ0100754.1 hypothetical protein [Thermoanaerobaculia bacterium]